MQTNQNIIGHNEVIDNSIWENLTSTFLNNESREIIIKIIVSISGKYNIEIKNIIKDYLNFIIRFKPEYINKKLLDFIEHIMHIQEPNISYLLSYTILKMKSLLILHSK